MTAAVYVVGGPNTDDRDDLRHSLRSLTNAPEITEAWVVGDVPTWFAGVKVPLLPLPEKFANQRQSLTAFVNYPGAPESFYLFNDDMFITEHVVGPLPICRNKNPASRWLDAEKNQGIRPNVWHKAVTSTASWMGERLGTDPLVYECHTPLLFDTARLRHLINAYPDQPFAVGELYPGAGIGGEGKHCGNAKVKAADSLAHKQALPMPYISGNPDSWDGALGQWIRGRFDKPGRWER
jgi:hypothetical protein